MRNVRLRDNPYRYEIVVTAILAPSILALETWRRWSELLSPRSLDDWLIFVSALIVARKLARGDAAAPRLWIFVCGGAWFIVSLSLWGSVYGRSVDDPSGFPMWAVITFKAVGFGLISVAAWRALWLACPADQRPRS